MNFDVRDIIQIIVIGAIVGFVIGWVFPIEGPIDYVYDNYASQPAHRSPKKSVTVQPKNIIIDVNDLSEEDFEALQEVFRN